jgi:PAS domain S-box-containing protein
MELAGPSDAILESAPYAVLTVDEQERVIWLNTAAAQLFGVARGDAIGHPFQRLATLPALEQLAGHSVCACEPRLEVTVIRTSTRPFRLTVWLREL